MIGLGSVIGAGVFAALALAALALAALAPAALAPAARAAGSGPLLGLALAAVVADCNATSSSGLAAG